MRRGELAPKGMPRWKGWDKVQEGCEDYSVEMVDVPSETGKQPEMKAMRELLEPERP